MHAIIYTRVLLAVCARKFTARTKKNYYVLYANEQSGQSCHERLYSLLYTTVVN